MSRKIPSGGINLFQSIYGLLSGYEARTGRAAMNLSLGNPDGVPAAALRELQARFAADPGYIYHTYAEDNDINQSKLLGVFTILSIVIANIGLFGLVALLNRKRVREIGIRKVNGAQKWQIVLLLAKQLLVWILIAVVIAIPVTWYVTRLWLRSFASQTSFSWWIIPLGGLVILIAALLTTAGKDYPRLNDGDVFVATLDYDGASGTAAQNVTIVLTFAEG